MRCNLRPNMVSCPLSPGKGLQITNLSEWTVAISLGMIGALAACRFNALLHLQCTAAATCQPCGGNVVQGISMWWSCS